MNRINNKGFTMIELISVISIVGILIIIATTSGLKAFENTKTKLKEEDEKNIVEAAKVLMTEVLYCDNDVNIDLLKTDNTNDFAIINGYSVGENVTCDKLQTKAKNGLKITLKYLYENNFVSGGEIDKIYKEDEDDDGIEISYTGKIDLTNMSIEVNKN